MKSLNSYNMLRLLKSLRLRPRKGEGRVRSRSTSETLVIGQFFRRARDFPPNAEKKFYALSNLFKSLPRN